MAKESKMTSNERHIVEQMKLELLIAAAGVAWQKHPDGNFQITPELRDELILLGRELQQYGYGRLFDVYRNVFSAKCPWKKINSKHGDYQVTVHLMPNGTYCNVSDAATEWSREKTQNEIAKEAIEGIFIT